MIKRREFLGHMAAGSAILTVPGFLAGCSVQQATAIAQAYMDEILVQPLNDPDGGETGAAEAGETRATFDDVSDYHGLADASGARDQTGAAIPGLDAYNVDVTVTAATLAGQPAKRITVNVGFDGDTSYRLPLTAFRLN